MTKFFLVTSILVQFSYFVCEGQSSIGKDGRCRIIIDSSVKKEVDKRIKGGELFTGQLDVIYYENDVKKDVLLFTGPQLPCYAAGALDKDSLTIILMGMMGASTTFFIHRSKDSCSVSFVSVGHDFTPSFKLNPTDTASTNVIPCTYRVILDRDQFKEGGPVYGYIEASSQPFYEIVDSRAIKKKMECKGYFRVEELHLITGVSSRRSTSGKQAFPHLFSYRYL